jgi:hypothetical protein
VQRRVPPGSAGAANSRPRRLAGPNADQTGLAVRFSVGLARPALASWPCPLTSAGPLRAALGLVQLPTERAPTGSRPTAVLLTAAVLTAVAWSRAAGAGRVVVSRPVT